MKVRFALLITIAAFLSLSLVSGQDPVRHATGGVLVSPDIYELLPRAISPAAVPLPLSVDLSPSFPQPGNQDPQGACVAFALSYAVRSYLEQIARKWGVSIDDHLFSPSFVFNSVRSVNNLRSADDKCRIGIPTLDALSFLQNTGDVPISRFRWDPNDCDSLPDNPTTIAAKAFTILRFFALPENNPNQIKVQLSIGHPVIMILPIDETFSNLKGRTYDGVSPGSSLVDTHAVAIGGYSDDRKAFHFINSWGQDWGERGWGWISYKAIQDATPGSMQFFVMIPVSNNPTADKKGSHLEASVSVVERIARDHGIKFVSTTTANHHCDHNCQGEPTRKNYTLDLRPDPGFKLRSPELRCVGGPCGGWNEVKRVEVESDGALVVGSWDVWAHPSTWELTAHEYDVIERPLYVTRIFELEVFSIRSHEGGLPPRVSVDIPSVGKCEFVAGDVCTLAQVDYLGSSADKGIVSYNYILHRPVDHP